MTIITRRTLATRLLLALAVVLTLGLAGCGGHELDGRTASDQASSKLNVIVIVTDDENDIPCAQFQRYMPQTALWLRDRGTCYENATVTAPSCCPSRAVLQTGQFPHNNGVEKQVEAPQLKIADTLQQHLTDAGYNTYGVGKFFNGESAFDFESGKKQSGFVSSDFWNTTKYYGFQVWDDALHKTVPVPGNANTTVYTGQLVDNFIRAQVGNPSPFYAYVAYKAPHTENSAGLGVGRFPTPTPKNAHRPVAPFKWDPEADTRDKLPIFNRKLHSRSYYQALYNARQRAVLDIDDQIGQTMRLLRDENMLDNTAILFMSDNGYHLGENGWETKGDPYRPAMNVPMLAYLPGTFAHKTDTRPVGLIDVAPTIYDLLHLDPGHTLDGHSLLSDYTRPGTFFELQNENSKVARAETGYRPGLVPTWAMYRSGSHSYIEYYKKDGSLLKREFYATSDQKYNLLWKGSKQHPDPATLRRYTAILRAGRTCAGTIESHATNPCP